MKRICVFCGSKEGKQPEYVEAARALGAEVAARGLGVVYGGAHVGLMGAVADGALERGGEVIGVIPTFLLEKELAHDGLTELREVSSMHERKAMMVNLSDGFISLPGGLGTFDETMEILTWAQLRIHEKPCGLLNVDGYYDRLIEFLDHASEQEFVSPAHRQMILMEHTPGRLLDKFGF
ncbi:MAG: TIGR00730 family Rossman fold protein [Gammaproteobacteria bacterium]|nr:TIGR00730 family Rossman fold protein [Gammaproteobacteria bacterium]